MKLVKLILMAILFGGILSVVGVPTKPHIVGEDANYGQNDIKTACINFNELNNKIRDNIISKNEAQKLFTSHILAVKNLFLVGVPTNPNIVGEDTMCVNLII